MPTTRHYFKLVSKFGPADLFKTLKNTCEDNRFRKQEPDFDFDWMKRKVEISARAKEGAEEVLEAVIARVNKKAGSGLLLPGDAKKADSRIAIPVGVLLQTPDVYAEIMTKTLGEFGVRSIKIEYEGDGFSVPLNAVNRAMEYQEMIENFPLPDYLKIKDEGMSE